MPKITDKGMNSTKNLRRNCIMQMLNIDYSLPPSGTYHSSILIFSLHANCTLCRLMQSFNLHQSIQVKFTHERQRSIRRAIKGKTSA